jgi:hypothetical protein
MQAKSCARATRAILCVFAAIACAVLGPSLGSAQSNPLIGTCKLNVARSTFSPGPAWRSMTLNFEAVAQGLRNTVEGVDGNGNPIRSTFIVIEDGKAHPVTGVPDFDSSIYKRLDAYTVDNTRMKAGRVVMTGTRFLSREGRTLTFTQKGLNANGQQINDVAVFDKQ